MIKKTGIIRGKQLLGAVSLFVAATLVSVACDDDDGSNYRHRKRDQVRPGQSSIEAKKRIRQNGAGLIEKASDDKKNGTLKLPSLSETDFIESSKHRDPFKPFLHVISRKEEVHQVVQREIKLKEYDVADLKLIAIITNIGDPRAMVVTPAKEGIVLRRGDYVGKADYIDPGGGGEKIQVNWRVARIHGSGREEERGIYLVRDDPMTKTPEDITRFMPLHSEK